MDYSCATTNRYGFLDSSDHGMTSSTTQNKRKTKKKRKPKHSKLVDKCINTEASTEATADVVEDVIQSQEQIATNTEQSVASDVKCDINDQQPDRDIETQTAESANALGTSSCGSPKPTDTSRDGTDDLDDMNDDPAGSLNSLKTKWSEICFEEEKSLKAEQEQKRTSEVTMADPELVFSEHRVYPTVYFYNSNFGNGNRRSIDWYDSDRHDRFNQQREPNNAQMKKVREMPRRRKKYTSTGTDDTYVDEKRSVDGRYADSYNESNDRSSQYTNESYQREFVNSTNRYNKFKHDTARFHSERGFTRRRSDFVRNV